MPPVAKGKAKRSRPSTGAAKKDHTDRWTARFEAVRPHAAPGAVQWAIRYAGPATASKAKPSEVPSIVCRCPVLSAVNVAGDAEDPETGLVDRTKESLAMVLSATGEPYTSPALPPSPAARSAVFERMAHEVLKWQWCTTLTGRRLDSIVVPHWDEEVDDDEREALDDWHLLRRVEAIRPIAAAPLAKATKTSLARATVDKNGSESANKSVKTAADGSYLEVWVREPNDVGERVSVVRWADCAILGQFGPEPFYLVGSSADASLQTHDFSDRRANQRGGITVDVQDITTPFIAIAAAQSVFGQAEQ